MSKLTLFWWLLAPLFWSFSTQANAQFLDVEFSGELVHLSCKVSAGSVKKEIQLENLRMESLNLGETSVITPFSIEIDHCQRAELGKLIKITWHGTQLVNIDGDNYLITQGDSGVILGIMDSKDKPIAWDEPIDVGSVAVVNDEQSLSFGVVARKPPYGYVDTGNFSGWATFSVEYK
ncbi:type 1 fimbrial protein [Providencia sp. JGM181]|uniref:fimbrial protein n=1 Tax=unclassified Providencia TaxID=2633465 RepID=UPI001BAAC8FF|nr:MULTISPECIES: fimbrial protein [unclassified Providencia]MBS0924837.1 type 1 fimbrial protein [Providencia sp. JGM181]MBS0935013.1 type 1 fimbrial protein [Providencia sp. JGM172]MBS0999216.1 type 1 fimbrial protein [Providencia sp. JGM178]